MEEYKKISKNVFVPSLLFFLIIAATIILAITFDLTGGYDSAGIFLGVLAVLVAPVIYRSALRTEGNGESRHAGSNAGRLLAMLFIAAVCSAAAYMRVHSLTGAERSALDAGVWTAHVEAVSQKRYWQEARVRFCKTRDHASLSTGPVWRSGLVRVTGGAGLVPGDVLRFPGTPKPAAPSKGMPSHYQRALVMQGVQYLFYCDPGTITIVSREPSIRRGIREKLAVNCDALFNRRTSSMVKALYFGNQDYIDKITIHDYKRAGVLHILSASGLHVGVVAAIPLFLLGLARVNKKAILAAASLTVLAYLYLTDMPVSLLRACIMFFIYACHRIFDREANIFNTLFLTAAGILLAWPGDLYGLGFQLSFGATLGLLLFQGSYRKTLSWLPGPVANPLSLTLAAQIPIIPVLLVQVGEVNLAGFASNIIVVPMTSLLLILSLAANALSFCAVLASPVAVVTDLLNGLCTAIVRFMSGLNGHFAVDAAGPVLFCAFCLSMLPLAPRLQGRRIMSLAIISAIGVAWLGLNAQGAANDAVTSVRHDRGTLLLVKDGPALAIIGSVPDKRHMGSVAGMIASSSCRDISLHITRTDYESIAGYTRLLRRIPAGTCYLSSDYVIRGYTRRFFELLDKDGVRLIVHDCTRTGLPSRSGGQHSLPEAVCRIYCGLLTGSSNWRQDPFCGNKEIRQIELR